ncbi:hypothetical protein BOX15_Mlig019672g3, partial [Macrostomum lignano]
RIPAAVELSYSFSNSHPNTHASMSWQSWVDNMLAYPGVNIAAIYGVDGSVWAKSPSCNPNPAEVTALIAGLGKSSAGEFTGFNFQGLRFMTIRLIDGEIDGRSGQSSLSAMKSSQCVVIGGYIDPADGSAPETAGSQKVNFAVAKVKEALANAGY